MTEDELVEILAKALDDHKTNSLVSYKVDRAMWSDGTADIYVDIPGSDSLRITIQKDG